MKDVIAYVCIILALTSYLKSDILSCSELQANRDAMLAYALSQDNSFDVMVDLEYGMVKLCEEEGIELQPADDGVFLYMLDEIIKEKGLN